MLASIIILLALILCVMLGITKVISFIFGLGVIWLCFAILGRNNPEAVNGVFLWTVGGLFLFAIIGAFFSDPDDKTCPRCAETIKWKAEVCKHCGHHQPETEPQAQLAFQSLKSQFDLRRWKDMSFTEYAGAGVMVIGVAVIGFLMLYVLIPQ